MILASRSDSTTHRASGGNIASSLAGHTSTKTLTPSRPPSYCPSSHSNSSSGPAPGPLAAHQHEQSTVSSTAPAGKKTRKRKIHSQSRMTSNLSRRSLCSVGSTVDASPRHQASSRPLVLPVSHTRTPSRRRARKRSLTLARGQGYAAGA